MKINATTAILFGVGGLALLAMLGRQQRYQDPSPTNFQNFPAPPPSTANQGQWQAWVALALNTFGEVAALWEPGGPFYNVTDTWEFEQAMAQLSTNGWNP